MIYIYDFQTTNCILCQKDTLKYSHSLSPFEVSLGSRREQKVIKQVID